MRNGEPVIKLVLKSIIAEPETVFNNIEKAIFDRLRCSIGELRLGR